MLNLGVADDTGTDDDADYDPEAFVAFSDGEGDCRVALHVHRDGAAELTWNTTREPG